MTPMGYLSLLLLLSLASLGTAAPPTCTRNEVGTPSFYTVSSGDTSVPINPNFIVFFPVTVPATTLGQVIVDFNIALDTFTGAGALGTGNIRLGLYGSNDGGVDLTIISQSLNSLFDNTKAGPYILNIAADPAFGTVTVPLYTSYFVAVATDTPYQPYTDNTDDDTYFQFFYNGVQSLPSPLSNPGVEDAFDAAIAFGTCPFASGGGDPIFVGFHGQRFLVKGLPERVYNLLSLPSLQLNTRFIPLSAGQAMNSTQQRAVRQRQAALISALLGKGAGNSLPGTVPWSHDGLYMGEAGVQVAGHRLHVTAGAYQSGFDMVTLDGRQLPVSTQAVQLSDGSTILRSTSSVVEVHTAELSFTLVNSDHFLNLHKAVLQPLSAEVDHVDGILGQTADSHFTVQKTAAFRQHIEDDFLIPAADDDLWSTDFIHSRYQQTAAPGQHK